MAPKKKSKKKSRAKSRAAKSSGSKSTPLRKLATPRKSAKKKAAKAPSKVPAKEKTSKRTVSGKAPSARRKQTGKNDRGREVFGFPRSASERRSGEESGDLQGLSSVESADSESVDELIEEGNAFEAGVVAGVEDAGEHDTREVHTREVPEDDVPGEYLDED
jgi:hypothetical protein